MSARKNINGMKFGKLKVLYETSRRNTTGTIYCMCICDCGNKKEVVKTSLISGNTRSCGCLIKEKLKREKIHYKHGGTHTKLYNIWWKMKGRCCNCNDKAYKNYGGRGITICDEWLNDYNSFKNWSESNGYVEGLSIDRIDNNAGYCPKNCRWATQKEQANNRRSNIKVKYNDKIYTLKELSAILNIKYTTLRIQYLNKTLMQKYEIEEV